MAAETGKIAVLMGGVSNEREISLRSGETVLKALLGEKLEAEGFDVKDEDFSGLLVELKRKNINAAFIALHGKTGEDGKIQRALEEAGIPYTGSGVAASAVCFNKLLTNTVLDSFEVPVPDYHFMTLMKKNCIPSYGFPVVVKPAQGGSAIGVTIADNSDELKEGIETAFREDDNILIERYIRGRELTVSIIGCGAGIRVLPLIEITTDEKFYNYSAKYVPGKSRHILPAGLAPPEEERVRITAEKVYRVLGCRGFARIDIILSGEGVPYVLDVNTIPGMTSTSLFPESAMAGGLPAGKLCRSLIEMALGNGAYSGLEALAE